MRRCIACLALILLYGCTGTGAPRRNPAVQRTPVSAEPTRRTPEQLLMEQRIAARAARVVGAVQLGAPMLSPDRAHLLFLANERGTDQAYLGLAAEPTAAPRALTHGSDGLDSATFTRDGRFVLYRHDTGFDEDFRIYRVGLDGRGVANLTPGPRERRDEPSLPLHAPELFFYSARRTTSAETRLYEGRVDGRLPRVVYTDPRPCIIADAAPDGTRVLLRRYLTLEDQVLLEVDVSLGVGRRLYPAEGGRAGVRAARYTADGKYVLVSTDEGGEAQSLLLLGGGGSIRARYLQERPPAGFLEQIQVAPQGDRVAVRVNAGNHTQLRLLSSRTLGLLKDVQVPLGMVSVAPFSSDGLLLPLAVSAPGQPPALHVVDAAGAVRPLRTSLRGVAPPASSVDARIEHVKAFDGLTIPVNVYLPRGGAGRRRPTLVYLHGGPSASAQVRWSPIIEALVREGFAFVEPNVRGSSGFGRAYELADNRERRGDVLRDLEAVRRWVKAQPWCDVQQVILAGQSYGGYLVLLGLTRQPTLWSAGVELFGPADLRSLLRSTDGGLRAVLAGEFGDLDRDAVLLERWSPLRDMRRVIAPLFVYAGQNDPRVPRAESDQVVKALRARGVPVEYMVASDEGHTLDRRATQIEFISRVVRFLDEQRRR